MSKVNYEGCDKCKHQSKNENEYPCIRCVHNAVEKFEPKTNGDRIREMTDEELTEIIMCPYDTAGKPEDIMPCIKDGDVQEMASPECKKCIMDWLRREAKK